MAKQKKKRNKAYRGADAKNAPASVVKLEAANRNRLSQWWFEKKRFVRPLAIAAFIIGLLVWLIIELLRVVF